VTAVLLTIAPVAAKVLPNTQPRRLEDEGFYVGIRPYVSCQNLNRMENRLLKEAAAGRGYGGHVTTDETRDEEACIGESGNDRDRVSSCCLIYSC